MSFLTWAANTVNNKIRIKLADDNNLLEVILNVELFIY